MARTVTATASGTGSANGIALTVKVVDNAAATQTGATANSDTITVPELSITPSATGSWVYGAVIQGNSSTAFTAAATTTFSQNISDTTHGAAYGTFRTTSTTTASTPVTVGASAPTVPSGEANIAVAEILASGTLSEDASSPAGVDTTAAKTITTASFLPPGGSLLVAMVSADYSGSSTVTMTVSDSGGLTWTKLAADPIGLTSVWIAAVPSTTMTGSLAMAPLGVSGTGAETFAASGSLAMAPLGIAASGAGGNTTMTGSLALAPLGIAASGAGGNTTMTGSLALAPLRTAGTGSGGTELFPDSPLDLAVELLLNSIWTDITSYIDHGPVSIGRGHPDESTTTAPATLAATLTNTDGRFTSVNPVSPYYPYLSRNVASRVSIPAQYVYLRTETDNVSACTCPTSGSLNLSGDLDLRVDYQNSGLQQNGGGSLVSLLAAKAGVSGEYSWVVQLNADWTVSFFWSPDGSSLTEASSGVPVPYGRYTLRVTLQVSTGTCTFYTGAAGNADSSTGWTQLGTATVAGATSIFASTADVSAGNTSSTALQASGMTGSVFELELRAGIGGTVVAHPVWTAQTAGATSFTDAQGNTWTCYGTAEISGRMYRGHFETPEWPQAQSPGGQDVTVAVGGGGLLRRIGQRNNPANSTMYRAWTKAASAVAAYWPFEDSAGATSIAAAIGGQPMYFSGSPTLASNSDYACSSPLPVTNGATFAAQVPAYDGTWSGNQVSFLLDVPSAGDTNGAAIATISTTGTIAAISVFLYTGGGLGLTAWNSSGTQLFTTGSVAFGVDGAPCLCWVSLTPSGSSINWELATVEPDAVNSLSYTGTLASASIGAVTRVMLNGGPGGNGLLSTTVLGHCAVQAETGDLTPLGGPLNAWQQEAAAVRFARLCYEEGIQFRGTGNLTATPEMGVQSAETITQLLQECADADRGVWTELRQQLGFGYVCRSALYNQAAQVTVTYSQDYLSQWDPDPLEDDQTTVNDVIVTQTATTASVTGTSTAAAGGSSARQYAAPGQPVTGGRLSVLSPQDGGMGTYDQTYSLNLASASDLDNEAGWIIHVGTVDQQRFPGIVLDLTNRELASLFWAILELDLGQRLVIDQPPVWLGWDPLSQLAQGLQEDLFYKTLKITINGVPELPYEVAADGAGFHVDTDGSTLNTAVSSTATTLSVATDTGYPLWSTSGADVPFDINISGERITVTAVSGSSSPQTFTVTRSVNGVVKAQAAGNAVALFNTPIAAL